MTSGCLQVAQNGMRDCQSLTQEDWQALHRERNIITASEVGTILGVNPYKSPYTLWAEKTGRVERSEGSLHTRIGKALEHLIADEYQAQTMRPIYDPGDYAVWQHPDLEWLFCTPDRFAIQADTPDSYVARVVELKWGGDYTRKAWDTDNEAAPLAYQVQNQIQMACVGLDLGSVAGIIGGTFINTDTRLNAAFLKAALRRIDEFRQMVLRDEAPPVDDSENTYRTLKALHPKDNGNTVILNTEDSSAVHRLKLVKDHISSLEKEELGLKNLVLAGIGDNTFAQTCDGALKLSYKWFERKGYEVKPTEGRTLRFCK
ncbi:MAG: hypothetical protein AMXMBFR84_37520 [Candidatus Hydrogenedentota bacterium]